MTPDELLQHIDQAAAEGWTELELAGEKLTELPGAICKLTELKQLNLSRNHLSELPLEIAQLANLEKLYLSSNELRKLPIEIGQLANLQKLDLSSNKLSKLPTEIGQLAKLQKLYLNSNQLNKLPAEIGQLTNLQQLSLSNNGLMELTVEIGQLTNLQQLSFNISQLSKLPVEIGQLTNLQELYLSDSKLSELPAEIGQLANLQKLDLRFNYELVDPPPEIVRQGTQAVLNYLRQKLEQGEDHLYEAKFLIVGEGEAGKTTLANKLLQSDFALDSQQASTEGIDVHRWDFELGDGTPFRANIWDFGGQEIYHATHQFFLTKRALYALVVDSRKQNVDLRYWLSVIDLLSDGSPALIVKNEKGDRPCDVNERELRGEFLNLKETLVTNFQTNRGLDELKQTIRQYITTLPHVGTALPKKWVEVRQALEADERNYISLGEYSRICKAHGFTERADQLQLSEYLHDLGVCLHFQDDDLLRKTIILKPEWGTTAVYNALDTPEVVRNQGRFSRDLLETIWSDDEYIDMQGELLQLMMRFKLCYEIPGRPNHYIAPHLLEPNQPQYTWDNNSNLIFRYRYTFMPKGMITRLIVELNHYIEAQQLVWKNGAVFTNGSARAEVIESYGNREIRIRVSGHEQKVWLSVITHELEKIHRSYDHLKYETLIPCNCSDCKGSQNPYHYPYDRLQKFLHKGNPIQCQESGDMVDVRGLLDDILHPASASSETPEPSGSPGANPPGLSPQTVSDILSNTPTQLPPNPMAINLDISTRLKLIRTLNELPPLEFQQMVAALKPPGGLVSSSPSSASELLGWAEGPTGPSLEVLLQVLDNFVPLSTLGISLPNQVAHPTVGVQPTSQNSTAASASVTPKEVFISYAWGGDSEEMANKIDQTFATTDITLIRDKRDLGFKGRIKAFMEQIGQGNAVIVVISDKYLKSENCMFELVEIAANGDFYDRIFPIVLPDAQIYKPVQRIRYIQHWEQEIAELDEAMKSVSSANLQGFP
jgi:internalin A